MNARVNIALPDIGSAFEGGFYGGRIQSHGGAKLFAVVWAPKALGETEGAWLKKAKDIPGARSCFHSMDNTIAMAEAGSAIAKWILGREINGHADWCLPARDVLELAYRHLKPTDAETGGFYRDGDNPSSVPAGYPYSIEPPVQTSASAFRAGGPEAFEEAWYWSSTQYSASYAWGHYFHYGSQYYYGKSYEARARAVRLIQLNP